MNTENCKVSVAYTCSAIIIYFLTDVPFVGLHLNEPYSYLKVMKSACILSFCKSKTPTFQLVPECFLMLEI